ncbi:MAG: hypothetical protein A3I66_10960 [Burkholderiales bacterium RIFCSPLOWO2_02_FULL_57_36]|nr:MAG: hypothetical protein A3I66_10960 [Burkholderiales bacterium RIFCSPLOWO2_02_FULL_57_36]
MKSIRILLIAASALAFVNVAHAQSTPSSTTSVTVVTAAPAYSNDPMVQKRHDDSIAKKEYKARKKAAKKEMKMEKKEAKIELKAEKAESTEVRNQALAADPISRKP